MRTGRGRWGLVGLRAVALAVAIAAAGVSTASANTVLHVDAVHGADTSNCQGSPCKTLTYAVLQGRLVADLITIQAAAGVYAEDLALGSADSGLTITGAGSGADPAANTVIIGTGPQPTIAATDPLSLSHLRILNPASDAQDAVRTTGAGAAVSLSDVAIDQQGTGAAVTAGGDIAITGGSVTLESAGSSATAIVGAGSVALERSPIIVNGAGGAVQSGAAASLSNLSVTLEDAAEPAHRAGAVRSRIHA